MPGKRREEMYVKICGITRVADAELCVDAGASAIGLNFVATSKRRVTEALAREIVDAVHGRVEIVAVIADRSPSEIIALRDSVGVDYLQLHGVESAETLSCVLPFAFKAICIGGVEDVFAARAFGGERLLADAKVEGETGGTGVTFDWALVRELAGERRLVLAGGLRPDNVAAAIRDVHPWGVDVASGVESAPGVKDGMKVRAFVAAARAGSNP